MGKDYLYMKECTIKLSQTTQIMKAFLVEYVTKAKYPVRAWWYQCISIRGRFLNTINIVSISSGIFETTHKKVQYPATLSVKQGPISVKVPEL